MITKQTRLIKNLKPINTDIHLQYKCPTCDINHWISLREASTRGFIIVCECNSILKPKLIDDIKFKYKQKIKVQTPISTDINLVVSEPMESAKTEFNQEVASTEPSVIMADPPQDLFNACVPALTGYGFTSSEAKQLIYDTYQKQKTYSTYADFIKHCLSNIPLENENNE
jgi:hypothetical protein